MKDCICNWINGDSEISCFIREGFIKLFTTSLTTSSLTAWNPPFWRCALKEIDKRALNCPVTDKEIHAAFWSLKPYKASGPDGLHVGFFPKILAVGKGLCQESSQKGFLLL